MRTDVHPAATTPDRPTRATTKREDTVTVLIGTWLIIGLFLDGYAHQHLVTGTESFLTPWHGVFYAGFAAASAWLAVLAARRPGRRLLDRIPVGYGAAVVGLGLFAIGGAGDAVWHSVFGVEVGIDALLSPTHLVLMAGLMAIVTAPYRAAVAERRPDKRGVAVVSLGVGTGLAAFFLNFVWGLGDAGFRTSYDAASGDGELPLIAGVATALVTTVVLSLAVTFALRLGRSRFGSYTLLFGLVAGAVHIAFEEELVGVAAALVAGLVLDVVLAVSDRRDRIIVALPLSASVMWTVYLVAPLVTGDLAWPPEVWSGTIVLAALVAAAIGYHASLVLDRTADLRDYEDSAPYVATRRSFAPPLNI